MINQIGLKVAISGLYNKQVMIVIYDRNDSDQYYKTTITIVIDDPSLSYRRQKWCSKL
jgi:hypothetical protein